MGLDLPRYVTARSRKDGTQRFYFQVPEWMRPDNWPPYVRLSDDVGEMFRQAEDLNRRMDAESSGAPVVAYAEGSIPWLLSDYHKSENYRELSKKTQELYDYNAKFIVEWSREKGHPHVKYIKRSHCKEFLRRFNDNPTKKRNLGTFLSVLLAYAMDLDLIDGNPAVRMGISVPDPVVHIWTEAEIDTMVAQADALGLPQVGDAILLCTEIGQRQADILKWEHGREYRDGVFLFWQQKTKEYLQIEPTDKLRARLEARGQSAGLVVPTQGGKRYLRGNFTKLFNRTRGAAGMNHLWFMHLRHTCVVRLARAGCTEAEIAAITGHTLTSVKAILKRYLPRDTKVANSAIQKVNVSRLPKQAVET